MSRFLIFMGITFLQGLAGFCQSRETFIVKGKVVDDATGEPVSYATLSLQLNGINTMSNESGQFIFRVPSESSKDSINVSHVGYVPGSILIVSSAEGLIIRLKQKIEALEEVKLTSTNALELVR